MNREYLKLKKSLKDRNQQWEETALELETLEESFWAEKSLDWLSMSACWGLVPLFPLYCKDYLFWYVSKLLAKFSRNIRILSELFTN